VFRSDEIGGARDSRRLVDGHGVMHGQNLCLNCGVDSFDVFVVYSILL